MDRLMRAPFVLMMVLYLGYLGYDYYVFNYSPEGDIEQHRSHVASAKSEVDSLNKKLDEGKKFLKTLDLKREEIQGQIKKLGEFQGALAEAPDVPVLLKLLDTEAKRAELKVDKIEPGRKDSREYYLEQEFKFEARGSFQNLLLFIHRISQLQRILRVEGYGFRIAGTSISARSITLTANLSIRAFQYLISKEDKMNVSAPVSPPPVASGAPARAIPPAGGAASAGVPKPGFPGKPNPELKGLPAE
jgi:Tfp pilus assembly protein PilO